MIKFTNEKGTNFYHVGDMRLTEEQYVNGYREDVTKRYTIYKPDQENTPKAPTGYEAIEFAGTVYWVNSKEDPKIKNALKNKGKLDAAAEKSTN